MAIARMFVVLLVILASSVASSEDSKKAIFWSAQVRTSEGNLVGFGEMPPVIRVQLDAAIDVAGDRPGVDYIDFVLCRRGTMTVDGELFSDRLNESGLFYISTTELSIGAARLIVGPTMHCDPNRFRQSLGGRELNGVDDAAAMPYAADCRGVVNEILSSMSILVGVPARLPTLAEWSTAAGLSQLGEPVSDRLLHGEIEAVAELRGRRMLSVNDGPSNAQGLKNVFGNVAEAVDMTRAERRAMSELVVDRAPTAIPILPVARNRAVFFQDTVSDVGGSFLQDAQGVADATSAENLLASRAADWNRMNAVGIRIVLDIEQVNVPTLWVPPSD